MLRGTLCLPRRGIQGVPEQLAAALPAGTVRLETPVRALTEDGAALADGTEVPARAVIVATGAAEAAALLPGGPQVPGGASASGPRGRALFLNMSLPAAPLRPPAALGTPCGQRRTFRVLLSSLTK